MEANPNSARTRSRVWILLLAIASTAVWADEPATALRADVPARFTVHELTLGGSFSGVRAVSDGAAVGAASIPGDAARHAFVWTEERGIRDIGTLGGTQSVASAVDGMHVVGASLTAGDADFHAFIWSSNAGMRDLGTLGGTYSGASSISGGVVVGESTTATGDIHAFRWTRETGMVDLGTLGGGTESAAMQVNRGLTAGFSTVQGTSTRRPVVWDASGQLFDVVGSPLDIEDGRVRNEGQATAVHRGAVVGHFRATPAPELFIHAFVWTVPHGFFDLGVPPGYQESFAFATNGDLIVGALGTQFEQRPFVWTRSDGFIDLGTLNGDSRAAAVNRHGWVVGSFILPEGGSGTFLWARTTGMRDVTPASTIFPFGAFPVGIDDEGRIAVRDQRDFEIEGQSAVLVPQKR
jgi:probable HAF family extracellular repeat protein